MATLKVYSREYGLKKVEEKVQLTLLEWCSYTIIPIVLFVTVSYTLNFYSVTYSMKQNISDNNNTIKTMKNNNEEQRVLINNLSSYDRIKEISTVIGMESNKDNVRVIR